MTEYVLEIMYEGGRAPFSRVFLITQVEYKAKTEWLRKITNAPEAFVQMGFDITGGLLFIDLSKAQGFKLYEREKINKVEDRADNPDMNNPLARNESLYDDPTN